MKTDRFTDIIRRKLESIRPEFNEKDWNRMQASLQTGIPQPGLPTAGQPFSGGIWTAKTWLMAAATVSTVVLVAFSFWQRNEINHLRQTIGQLTKHPTHQTKSEQQPDLNVSKVDAPNLTRLEKGQSQTSQKSNPLSDNLSARPLQHDTVYITRQVAVSPRSTQSLPLPEERPVDRLETPAEQRYATADKAPVSRNLSGQTDNLTNNPKTDAYGAPSTSSIAINEKNNNSSVLTTKATRQLARRQRDKSEYIDHRATRNRRLALENSVANQTGEVAVTMPTQPAPVETAQTAATANYELATSLPMSTPTVNWASRLVQRAKSVRSARINPPVEQAPATAVVAKAEPTSQPVRQAITRFRAGVGAEIASHVSSAGVFTEVLAGKHLTVGLGIQQTTYNGVFINDYEFDEHTRRDFRKEFARGIDPRRDILNINMQTTRLQMPIYLGYRIPLTRSLTLLTTVGSSLNLSSRENVTFYCPVFIPQQRGLDEFKAPNNGRPFALINNFALGAGLEWQHRHWVVQGSPVLTVPMQIENDPNWQNSTTIGLRARVLYQF